jgi:plasmid stabilization system protein ParE
MKKQRGIRWAEKAADDLNGIADYIAKDNVKAARDFVKYVHEAVIDLSISPIGRQGERPGTAEKVLRLIQPTLSFILLTTRSYMSSAYSILRKITSPNELVTHRFK